MAKYESMKPTAFMKSLIVCALSVAASCLWAQGSFTHGVASGDPGHEEVVLWTRYVPEDSADTWIVWEMVDEDRFRTVDQGKVLATQTHDFCVKVRANGLMPGKRYLYRFYDHDRRVSSVLGYTQTLPLQTDHVRIGVINCAKYTGGYYHLFEELAKMEVDVVIHLGDYIYENGPSTPGSSYWPAYLATGRQHDPPHECFSLEDYRRRYAQYRSDTSLQKLHARFPMITIWDDHEIAMKSLKKQPDGSLQYKGDWQKRFDNSIQAYHEWLPIGVTPFDPIYRSFQFGDLVNLMMLDTRVCCKSEVTKTKESLADTNRHIIGNEQLAWIKKEITDHQATWNVFGNQLLMATKDQDWNRWPGFPHDRGRLLDFIQANDHLNYMVTTGNAHNPHHYLVLNEARTDTVMHEFLPGSISSGNKAEKAFYDKKKLAKAAKKLTAAGNVKWFAQDGHWFIVLDLTPGQTQVDYYMASTIRSTTYTFKKGYSYTLKNRSEAAKR